MLSAGLGAVAAVGVLGVPIAYGDAVGPSVEGVITGRVGRGVGVTNAAGVRTASGYGTAVVLTLAGNGTDSSSVPELWGVEDVLSRQDIDENTAIATTRIVRIPLISVPFSNI